MSRDTNRVQRKVRIPSSKRKKSGAKKEKKPGEIPCGISSCSNFADKHLGGRSLSQENAIDTWGKEPSRLGKTEFEYASPVTRYGRKTTKMSQTHIIDSLSLSPPVCTE